MKLDILTLDMLKGAALLYMLEKFLTQETFRSGLNDYLNTHKYSNADTKDLWTVLTKHANNSIQVKVSYKLYHPQWKPDLFTLDRVAKAPSLLLLVPRLGYRQNFCCHLSVYVSVLRGVPS